MEKKQPEVMVSICCITFNQKDYIRDALEGFLKQKTDFSYEILIHDDASGDGTGEIIREYVQRFPERIFPILQTENQYSKGLTNISGTFNFPRARGRYIAMCEGDDYWTDENKLQQQVDFMEAHPDCSICFHSAAVEVPVSYTHLMAEALPKDLDRVLYLDCDTVVAQSLKHLWNVRLGDRIAGAVMEPTIYKEVKESIGLGPVSYTHLDVYKRQEMRNVLTGFKWIGDQIAGLEAAGEVDRFIFGFEESYGYLAGPYVRDKDAVKMCIRDRLWNTSVYAS